MFAITALIKGASALLSGKAGDMAIRGSSFIATQIDEAKLTEEERIKYQGKNIQQNLDFQAINKDQNSVRSRVRRWLAIPLILNFIALVDYGVYSYVRGNKEVAEYIKEILAGRFGLVVLTVIIFYFGYVAVTNVVGKIKNK